jgi:hypothetical protein
MAHLTPLEAWFSRGNNRFCFHVGQLEIMVVLGIFFAILSLIIWRIKGRSISYFVSQFFSLAFVILAVALLFEKSVAWRMTECMLNEHHLAEKDYPQLFD